jgi:hypothetical protein
LVKLTVNVNFVRLEIAKQAICLQNVRFAAFKELSIRGFTYTD